MKKVLQKLVSEFSIIKKSKAYYKIQRFRQYRPLKIDKSLTSRPDIIDTLEKDGICIIPNFLNQEVCGQILQELEPVASEVLDGKRTKNINTFQLKQKAFRIGFVDEFSSTAKKCFFENEIINQTAKAFVSAQAISYRREADYKTQADNFFQSDLPHFDDWRHRFKAFLYVTDVGEENAPFVYFKRSHEQVPWKEPYHYEYERNGHSGRYGHFFPQEMAEIQKQYGYEKLVCLGKAGTLIFADFRGIHQGTPLKAGKRVLLNNTFGIELKGIL